MGQLKDRLVTFVNDSGAKSVSEFERNCGLTVGTISKCKEELRTDTLIKIANRYPTIDLYWILGIKHVKQVDLFEVMSETNNNASTTESFLMDQIKRKDETISVLQNIISNLQK